MSNIMIFSSRADKKTKHEVASGVRCCHISDTHARFPVLKGKFDLILHTGDFFPDIPFSIPNGENEFMAQRNFQMDWLISKLPEIKDWIEDKDFLFTAGNHDWVDSDAMETLLRANGINAYSLHMKKVTVQKIDFFGFPYVPPIGCFNYEKDDVEMQIEVDKLIDIVNHDNIDVIAAHCPMPNALDRNGIWGNPQMLNGLITQVKPGKLPKYYLCGHIHENHGITFKHDMLISNAATSQQIIEFFIKDDNLDP